MDKKTVVMTVLLLTSLFLTGSVKAEKSDAPVANSTAGSGSSLEKSTAYNTIVNYLQKVDETPLRENRMDETVTFFVIDLVFSFVCLWAAVWLFSREIKIVLRKYFWFIFFWNLCWFCTVIFLKGIWLVLDYLIVRLQPDVVGAVLDKFIPAVLLIALIIYVWVLARTFGLTSLGSVGVMFTSHLIYLTVIFLCLSFVFSADSQQFNAVRNYFGVKPIVYGYLSDIHSMISSNDILDFVRIRPFHL